MVVGAPIVYAPNVLEVANNRIVGTSVDDRAGCAVMLEVARALKGSAKRPTLHLVFSVQEEFNLRGAVTAAHALKPDIAIQLDLILATDTPDMTQRGDVKLGAGPGISLYSFHGRGTLNGTIPHPALVELFEKTAAAEKITLQRSAHIGALTDSSYVQVTGTGVACIDLGFPCRYTHSSLEMCDLADLEGLAQLLIGRHLAHRQELQPRPGPLSRMKHYLGVDIGTFETKGVIVDQGGRIVATAARPHQMLVPQPGWAEHRPEEDWWGDFVFVTRKMLADSRIAPSTIAAIGASAIGPCMLPVDADGAPLMNGVLYGIDTRAAEEIETLTRRIGVDRLIEKCGNALTSQSVGPKILWLKNKRPDLFAKTHKILTSTTYLVHRLTDRFVIDHYSAGSTSPLYLPDRLAYSDELASDIIALDKLPRAGLDHRHRRHGDAARGGRDRARRRHAGDRRHHRRGGGGAQRRRAEARRHDADVRLHHLHHRDHAQARGRQPRCGMRPGCSRASTPRCPASRPAAR